MLVVCNKCRCSNQFGAIFCRNCGEKLAILDMTHPDYNKTKVLWKILGRILNVALIVAAIALVVALFLPVSNPEYNLDDKAISELKLSCDALDIAYAKNEEKILKLSPAEATFAANFMLDEQRVPPTPPPPPGQQNKQSQSFKKQAATASIGANNTFTQKQGASLGPKQTMSLPPPVAAPPPAATPAAPVSSSDQGKPFLPKKHAEKEIPAEPNFTAAYLVEVKNGSDLCISIYGKMLRYLPYKLELNGVFKYIEPQEKTPGKLSFELKSAKFGHLPLPSFLRTQVPDLVSFMVSDKKLRYYTDKISAINIDNDGNIQVSVVK
jgi:uncharacterized protein YpmS